MAASQASFFDDDAPESIQGTVERIVFHNEGNGYTVFRLHEDRTAPDDLTTVVGVVPSPQVGIRLLVKGKWVNSPRFGRQFKMAFAEETLPATEDGIRLYLSSGLIKGVGKALADRIVKRFGKETLSVLDERPEELLAVPGISKAKLDVIRDCWAEHMGIRELMLYLQPHGVGASYALRIYKFYKGDALGVVRENPYRLAMDISGIGFVTADLLARKIGFATDSPLRAEAGALYTLTRLAEEGHVYYPREGLVTKTSDSLNIDPSLVDGAVDALARDERVVLEDLGGHQGVYLTRLHLYESKIAFYLRRLLKSPKAVRFDEAEQAVDEVVARMPITLAREQLDAVRTAAASKVMVLTGGPGTGKTTILKAIIELFAARGAKILLAAPTGRAAKRMAESCGREAKTIHRLLEYSPQNDGFSRNEDNPLACGLLVVDEASMMDVMLAYHLLKAAPLGATVIFVGDVNQLPSVGPGNVLKDFIASGAMAVVELVDVFRQAATSEIVCSAHMINRGEIPRLDGGKDRLSDFYFIRDSDPDRCADRIVDLVKNHIPRRFRLDPFNDIQVLTPMHKGSTGSASLNAKLQEALNPNGPGLVRGDRGYRLRDKVMQIRNNYDKDVFNGDIGRITDVDLEDRTILVDFDGRVVCYDADELDELVPAYAISIHKSQGSEYPAVIIPILTQHYVLLQRNLLYTAITRGKSLVVIVGETRALHMAIGNDKMQKRFTHLAERLGARP